MNRVCFGSAQHKRWSSLLSVVVLFLALVSSTGAQVPSTPQDALGTAFTYQGRLTNAGGPAPDAPRDANEVADPFYPDYEDLLDQLQDLAADYSDIASYQEIGQETHGAHREIVVLKISDNAADEEDEPAWVFNGIVHGSEQLGLRLLLDLATELTSEYGVNADVTDWVDAYEIWIVILLNPWGYDHDSAGDASVNGTRKNGEDTDDEDTSGVDLARNYDFRWDQWAETDPEASQYRGPDPFSEHETQAIRDFFRAQRPLFGITFHQGNDPDGGQVMRPWSTHDVDAPPDAERLEEVAELYADWVFASRTGGPFCNFTLEDPDGEGHCDAEGDEEFCDELCWELDQSTLGAYGQPSNWYYAAVGAFDYTVEISDHKFNGGFMHSADGPGDDDEQTVKDIATEFARNHQDAIKGWLGWFLHDTAPFRFTGPGITGHVRDALLDIPIAATIEVENYTSDLIEDRTADPEFGRFWRLLPADTHHVTISKPGYEPWEADVVVAGGALTGLEVTLTPQMEILYPNATALAYAGVPGAPRVFTVRVQIGSPGEPCVTGQDFVVEIRDDTAVWVGATVGPQACVQDHYWLSVTAPDGDFTEGETYDLRVSLDAVSDEEPAAVRFSDIRLDTIYITDRSGSMAEGGKLLAAQDAAEVLAHELYEDDQGALVSFSDDASLDFPLAPMSDANRDDLIDAINLLLPDNRTSIGDGLIAALDEIDGPRRNPDNGCALVLLSDGMENEPEMWEGNAALQDRAAASPCVIHVVGLGPQSNEPLLSEISQAGGGGPGTYEYATIEGALVAAAPSAPLLAPTWRNALGGVYDYIATQMAGRQRIFSAAGNVSAELVLQTIAVDNTAKEVVFTLKWEGDDDAQLELKDPNGLVVHPAYPGAVHRGGPTDDVYAISNPIPGDWLAVITRLDQNVPQVSYLLLASVQTDIRMRLFTSGDVGVIRWGDEVLIGVLLSRAENPETGATVHAVVTAPDGVDSRLTLYDDGAHGDGLADDGFYANWYRRTIAYDVVNPTAAEGEEPEVRGSYNVEATATGADFTRQALAAFVVVDALDTDGDDIPDDYETSHGLNPNDPGDAQADPDQDSLTNIGEFNAGTDPHDSDSDDGGENDYSEVYFGRDPLDPEDDQIAPVSGFAVDPLPNAARIRWTPDSLLRYTLWRKQPYLDWTIVNPNLLPTGIYSDTNLLNGVSYGYMLMAHDPSSPRASAITPPLDVTPRADPFPPTGRVLINDGAVSTFNRMISIALQSSSDTIEMRLSSALDDHSDGLSGRWRSYQPEMEKTIPPEVKPGDTYIVYVQFRDVAGNESEIYTAQIRFQPPLYLPVILRRWWPFAPTPTPTPTPTNTPTATSTPTPTSTSTPTPTPTPTDTSTPTPTPTDTSTPTPTPTHTSTTPTPTPTNTLPPDADGDGAPDPVNLCEVDLGGPINVGFDELRFWIKPSVATNAAHLRIRILRIDDPLNPNDCAAPISHGRCPTFELDIPALNANVWSEVFIELERKTGNGLVDHFSGGHRIVTLECREQCDGIVVHLDDIWLAKDLIATVDGIQRIPGGGATFQLNRAAGRTVSNETVYHDDTVAVRTWVQEADRPGGATLIAPPGIYYINQVELSGVGGVEGSYSLPLYNDIHPG